MAPDGLPFQGVEVLGYDLAGMLPAAPGGLAEPPPTDSVRRRATP